MTILNLFVLVAQSVNISAPWIFNLSVEKFGGCKYDPALSDVSDPTGPGDIPAPPRVRA